MIYNQFQDLQLSALGFGAMRLPLLENGEVDEAQVMEMVRYAADHGVNYYDTAYPYHGGKSELVMGKALAQLPRESFYLADKYPGHQHLTEHNPEKLFAEQLEKCGVDYFDFYLMHNVNEESMPVYLDEELGLVDFFVEKKRQGKIRHLGFSAHATLEGMKTFLDRYGDVMEFCQIQLNYLDWTLQDGKEKVELLKKWNIPVWVMEPVRGGKLANLPEEDVAVLKSLRPDETTVAWAFRFLQSVPEVTVTLSGMSSMAQLVENIATYETGAPLNNEEFVALQNIADKMKSAVPCTACRYCVDGCPAGLNIPQLMQLYNDYTLSNGAVTVLVVLEGLGADKGPAACLKCGACASSCPQRIAIPDLLEDFAAKMASAPKWADICRQREEARRKLALEQAEKQEKPQA